jgi:hypothetical protein
MGCYEIKNTSRISQLLMSDSDISDPGIGQCESCQKASVYWCRHCDNSVCKAHSGKCRSCLHRFCSMCWGEEDSFCPECRKEYTDKIIQDAIPPFPCYLCRKLIKAGDTEKFSAACDWCNRICCFKHFNECPDCNHVCCKVCQPRKKQQCIDCKRTDRELSPKRKKAMQYATKGDL